MDKSAFTVQREDANHYAKTAVEVFDLLINIPSPLSQFVFKRIVDDCYEISDILPKVTATEQLIYSICHSIDSEAKELKQLNAILPIEEHIKINKSEVLFDDRDELSQIMLSNCVWNELPNKSTLILAHECFNYRKIDSDEWKANTKNYISSRIQAGISDIRRYSFQDTNCFIKLSYISFFDQWIAKEAKYCSEDQNSLFFCWYCRGEIIDVILDTIANCKLYTISHALWYYLLNKCKGNPCLSVIVQSRIEEFRQFCPLIPEPNEELKKSSDQYIIEKGVDVLPKINCLPPGEEEYKNALTKLFNFFLDKGCLQEGHRIAFTNAFQGEGTTTPVHWLYSGKMKKSESRNKISTFFSFLYDDYALKEKTISEKEYRVKFCNIFYFNNGPYKINTIKHSKYEDREFYKELKELINGIKS